MRGSYSAAGGNRHMRTKYTGRNKHGYTRATYNCNSLVGNYTISAVHHDNMCIIPWSWMHTKYRAEVTRLEEAKIRIDFMLGQDHKPPEHPNQDDRGDIIAGCINCKQMHFRSIESRLHSRFTTCVVDECTR
eukprot:1152332-Pelagomonas_calceolata.AAC.10